MIYAYICISGKKQSYQRQKSKFVKYFKEQGVSVKDQQNITWIKETVTGARKAENRDLQKILDVIGAGDTFITDEISRISRSSLEVLSIIHQLIEKKCEVFIIESALRLKEESGSQALALGLSIAAQIEKELIKSRTKAGMRAAREKGVKLGRPKGSNSAMTRLHKNRKALESMLDKKITKSNIAKMLEVSRTTLNKYLKETNTNPDAARDN